MIQTATAHMVPDEVVDDGPPELFFIRRDVDRRWTPVNRLPVADDDPDELAEFCRCYQEGDPLPGETEHRGTVRVPFYLDDGLRPSWIESVDFCEFAPR